MRSRSNISGRQDWGGAGDVHDDGGHMASGDGVGGRAKAGLGAEGGEYDRMAVVFEVT